LFAVGDVPVDLQDDACLASVAFPHGPPTRYHDATTILLGVRQRSFPPTTLGKFGFNLWQGTGKLGSQKRVCHLSKSRLFGPAIHLPGSVAPESDDSLGSTNDDRIVGKIEQFRLLPQRRLRSSPLRHVTEYQHTADNLALAVTDRGGTVVDG